MAAKRQAHAPVFAALGDETRLALVAKLSGGQPRSISQLTEGIQAYPAGDYQASSRFGESQTRAQRPHGAREPVRIPSGADSRSQEYLDLVSEQWDETLSRLKAFVED